MWMPKEIKPSLFKYTCPCHVDCPSTAVVSARLDTSVPYSNFGRSMAKRKSPVFGLIRLVRREPEPDVVPAAAGEDRKGFYGFPPSPHGALVHPQRLSVQPSLTSSLKRVRSVVRADRRHCLTNLLRRMSVGERSAVSRRSSGLPLKQVHHSDRPAIRARNGSPKFTLFRTSHVPQLPAPRQGPN